MHLGLQRERMGRSDMKQYLKTTNLMMLVISTIIGWALYGVGLTYTRFAQKESQIVLLLIFFVISHFFIEIGALRRLEWSTSIQVIGNPLFKVAIGKFILIFLLGVLVYHRYRIDGLFSQVAFSVLANFFVGAVFESYRFLRRPE